MVRAYAFGVFTAALIVVVVAALWFGVQPKENDGLLWGNNVYSSKQEFNGYLKSKGLSYKTWLARNPGVAPWEPDTFRLGAITVEASEKKVQLIAAVVAWLLATCGAVLLLRNSGTTSRFERTAAALFSTVLAVVLVAGFWYGTQPKEKGLLWGGAVYTSKEQFNLYLKAKGLSYKTWLARNPGAAPWEPEPVQSATARESAKAPPAKQVRRPVTQQRQPAGASAARESNDGFPLPSLFLPALGLTLVMGFFVMLLRARRPVGARLATTAGTIPRAQVGGWGSTLSATAIASTQRLGRATLRSAGRVGAVAPIYGSRAGRASREATRLLLHYARINGIGLRHVVIGVLVVVGAIAWGALVVFMLSAL